MASIFLSYVREDVDKARAIAGLLGRRGHSVWWDRHIKGGAQFASEIEAALTAADKVVVLWSARSAGSRWVRDEAAVGGDSGRLVPITIDGTEAPLGFRQFHTIDFSRWRGRSDSPQWRGLMEAIASDQLLVTSPSTARGGPGARVRLAALIAVALVATVAAGAWYLFGDEAPDYTLVAIGPADGSSSSRQAAHDLTIKLGTFAAGSTGLRLGEVGSLSAGEGRLRVQVKGNPSGRRDLTLLSMDGAMLWSATIEGAGHPEELEQRAAVAVQGALSCAAEALAYRRERIDQDTLRLYVTSCTRVDDAYGTIDTDEAVIRALQGVIAKAPHFEAAWAKLFAAEIETRGAADTGALQAQVARAERLGLRLSELEAMKANLISPIDFEAIFKTYDEGISRYPDSALLHRMRGERQTVVGRMNAAVADTARAVQLGPLSPANRHTFATTLAYAGNIQAGYEQLREAERLWPESTTLAMARYRLDLRYGNPNEALLIFRQSPPTARNTAQEAFIRARLRPTRKNIAEAIAAERQVYAQTPIRFTGLVQALAQFGRKDEIIDILLNYRGGATIGYDAEVLFRPGIRDIWHNRRSIAAAAHLGLLKYWKKSGNWPDFCFDPTLPYDCKKEAAKYPV